MICSTSAFQSAILVWIEFVSQFYRNLPPTVTWIRHLTGDSAHSLGFRIFFCTLYIFFKVLLTWRKPYWKRCIFCRLRWWKSTFGSSEWELIFSWNLCGGIDQSHLILVYQQTTKFSLASMCVGWELCSGGTMFQILWYSNKVACISSWGNSLDSLLVLHFRVN